jgi:hypothetical protein
MTVKALPGTLASIFCVEMRLLGDGTDRRSPRSTLQLDGLNNIFLISYTQIIINTNAAQLALNEGEGLLRRNRILEGARDGIEIRRAQGCGQPRPGRENGRPEPPRATSGQR